jgi:hypothetical protein
MQLRRKPPERKVVAKHRQDQQQGQDVPEQRYERIA